MAWKALKKTYNDILLLELQYRRNQHEDYD